MAAMGNKILGKGWESTKYYQNVELTFHNIANLDGVARSYKMLMQNRMDPAR